MKEDGKKAKRKMIEAVRKEEGRAGKVEWRCEILYLEWEREWGKVKWGRLGGWKRRT